MSSRRVKTGRLLIAFAAIGWFSTLALAQGEPSPPFRIYSAADGLSGRSSQSIAQDHHGIIWIGTFFGLNRFDGQRFRTLTTRDGLLANGVTSLIVDDQNRLWLGHDHGGLTLLAGGRVVRTIAPHPEQARPIVAIHQDGHRLYLGSRGAGMSRLDIRAADPQLVMVHGAPNNVQQIADAGNGKFLVREALGLWLFDPEASPSFTEIDETVSALSREPGRIFAGSSEGLVGHWSGERIDWGTTNFGATIWGIAQRGGVPVWVSTPEYLVPVAHPQRRIPLARAWNLMLDRDESLWGITAVGPVRYLGERFTHYPFETGGVSTLVNAIARGPDENYWFGTGDGLVVTRSQPSLTGEQRQTTVTGCYVRDLVFSGDQQTLWVGCMNTPLLRVDVATLKVNPVTEHDYDILDLVMDPTGKVWAGAKQGVLRYDPSTGSDDLILTGVDSVYAVVRDDQGYVWYATEFSGVYRVLWGNDELTPELVIPATAIAGSPVDMHLHGGALWIASDSGVVYRWRDGEMDLTLEHHAFSNESIYTLQPLDDGTLVIGTERGLYRYDVATQAIEFYSADQGYKGVETRVHAKFLEDAETLWIGTAGGVTRMDLSIPMQAASAPRPSVVSVVAGADSSELTLQESPELSASRVTFQYIAVSTRQSGAVEYSYRIAGLDGEWSTPATADTISYSNLPPGEFQFQVKARRLDGGWSEPATWNFSVPTPWWGQWWFRAAMLAALVALIIVLIRWRTRHMASRLTRLDAQKREVEALVTQRTAELSDTNCRLEQSLVELNKAQQLAADLSRRAGQADVASEIMHNLGNVLNSVNVSAQVLAEKLTVLSGHSLRRLGEMLRKGGTCVENERALADYVDKLAAQLDEKSESAQTELEELTNHVAHIANVVNGQQRIAEGGGLREICSVEHILVEAIRLNSGSLAKHGVSIDTHLDADIEVCVDRHQILQILVNLIANAKDAMSEVLPDDRHIDISAQLEGDDVLIRVSDAGCGMTADTLAEIFEQGFTTKAGGSGIGLHSAANIAGRLGGSLSAESGGLGLGAEFTLRLPIGSPESDETADEQHAIPVAG